jgi:hypothetical protein
MSFCEADAARWTRSLRNGIDRICLFGTDRAPATNPKGSGPETWVTECTGQMGNTFWAEGIFERLLRMTRLDTLDADAEAQPPDGEFAEIG